MPGMTHQRKGKNKSKTVYKNYLQPVNPGKNGLSSNQGKEKIKLGWNQRTHLDILISDDLRSII